jgi:hypothetical protein
MRAAASRVNALPITGTSTLSGNGRPAAPLGAQVTAGAELIFEFEPRSVIIWLAMIYFNGLAQAMLCIGSRGSIRTFPYWIPPAA